MRNGKCPKCSSADIYSGVHVQVKGGGGGSNKIPITTLTGASLTNYVCVSCGYVESYVIEKSKLDKIKNKWPHLSQEELEEGMI